MRPAGPLIGPLALGAKVGLLPSQAIPHSGDFPVICEASGPDQCTLHWISGCGGNPGLGTRPAGPGAMKKPTSAKRLTGWALLTLSGAAFALAGCNTTEGLGKDIEQMGEAIEDSAQDAS